MILTPPAYHAPAQEAVDRGHFLSAQGQVESGLKLDAIGKKGELGPWQFTKATWKAHMPGYDFATGATDPVLSALAARRRFDWIVGHLGTRGIPVTVENVSACWLCGLSGGIRRILHGDLPEPAGRVANLYRAEMAVAPLKLD